MLLLAFLGTSYLFCHNPYLINEALRQLKRDLMEFAHHSIFMDIADYYRSLRRSLITERHLQTIFLFSVDQ